jgi:two-component system chemotaxis response regulator CheY
MLHAPTRCSRDFRLLAEAPTVPLTCGIRSGNGLYDAALFVEVDRRDYSGLLPGKATDGEILDFIGEIANVMAGRFLGQRSFRKHFGLHPGRYYDKFRKIIHGIHGPFHSKGRVDMKKSVVIVDDSKFIVMMLQDFFQEVMGYEVLATGCNGIQAVDLYRKHKPDLLTLDLTMPIKDGQTALVEILGEFPAARVMVISALDDSTLLECVKMGAKAYMEKPLQLEDEEYRRDFLETLEEAFPPESGNGQ